MDELLRGWLDRAAGEQADGEVERPPPRVHGGRPAAERRPELRQHVGGLVRGLQIAGRVRRLVLPALAVLVERRRPRRLLRGHEDLDLTGQYADGGEQAV